MSSIRISFVSFLLFNCASARRRRGAFTHFYGDVAFELTQAVTQNCSAELQPYQHENVTLYGHQCVKMYSCVMANIPEYTKGNMASAAVLLGLAPWILSTLGSSTTEMSLLSSRRPVLAALLVLGSPAMNPIKTFEYRNPIEEYLRPRDDQIMPGRLTSLQDASVVILQLFIAVGNLVNLGLLSWDLALKTIPVMSCDSEMLPALWIGLSLITHVLGIMTFFSRMRILGTDSSGIVDWIRNRTKLVYEIRTCGNASADLTAKLDWGSENKTFIFLAWLTSVYTVFHLAFGTLVFSQRNK